MVLPCGDVTRTLHVRAGACPAGFFVLPPPRLMVPLTWAGRRAVTAAADRVGVMTLTSAPPRVRPTARTPTARTPHRGYAQPWPVRAPRGRVRRHRTDPRCGARPPAGRGPTGAIVRPARTSSGDRTLPPLAATASWHIRSVATNTKPRAASAALDRRDSPAGICGDRRSPRRDMGPGQGPHKSAPLPCAYEARTASDPSDEHRAHRCATCP